RGPRPHGHEGGGRRPAAGGADDGGAARPPVHHRRCRSRDRGRQGRRPPRDRRRRRGRRGAAARGAHHHEGLLRAALPRAQGHHGGEEEADRGEGCAARREQTEAPEDLSTPGTARRQDRGTGCRRGAGARAAPPRGSEGAVMANVLAIVEQRDGALRRVSFEVVSAARTIAEAVGGEVHALLIGPAGSSSAAAELGKYGAARVHVAEGDAVASYMPDAYAATAAALARSADWYAIVFPASATGRDLAPRVAAKLGVPLAADVTALEVENGE